MTEQELQEKIADLILRHGDGRIGMVEGFEVKDYTQPIEVTSQILTLIKEAGYVRLAEDQGLPEPSIESASYENASQKVSSWIQRSGYAIAQQDMLKAGWRKVEVDNASK